MFSCSECNFKSERRSNVKRHHQRSHGEKKIQGDYRCNSCSYTTNLPYNIRRHKIQENHGQAEEQQSEGQQIEEQEQQSEQGHQTQEQRQQSDAHQTQQQGHQTQEQEQQSEEGHQTHEQGHQTQEEAQQTEYSTPTSTLGCNEPVTPSKWKLEYDTPTSSWNFNIEMVEKMYALNHTDIKWKCFDWQRKMFNKRLAKLATGHFNDDVCLFSLHRVVEDQGGFHRIKNWDKVAAVLGSTPETLKDLYESRLLVMEIMEKRRKSELSALEIPFWWDDGEPVSFTNRDIFPNPNVVSIGSVTNVLRKIFTDYYLPSQVTDFPFKIKDTWMYVTKMSGRLILTNMENMYIKGAESEIRF